MHRHKLDNVLKLDAPARCDYFVRKIADFAVVWGLFDAGWATAQQGGAIVIPFWPEAAFAAVCADVGWSACRPKPISLADFLSRWLPGMARDGRLCAVFPVPGQAGLPMQPLDLLERIAQEARQYE
ncbi:hypothetical protein WK72_10250 [Burkholderia ubonensis]|uniref:DUF2750 domain-containing protein n=1 Tax=Burkholderia ubonensis TaxID=101571 RepID=UPI00075D8C6E|nr:DUF2750 domain-containing protein [Burkholderia ubonensis]KVU70885.1 hypothetical protein WK72_10250 [Burkholderia ubonensis]KWH12761.1 hypothetical protein WL97_18235 [Burkholderia ubonensis]